MGKCSRVYQRIKNAVKEARTKMKNRKSKISTDGQDPPVKSTQPTSTDDKEPPIGTTQSASTDSLESLVNSTQSTTIDGWESPIKSTRPPSADDQEPPVNSTQPKFTDDQESPIDNTQITYIDDQEPPINSAQPTSADNQEPPFNNTQSTSTDGHESLLDATQSTSIDDQEPPFDNIQREVAGYNHLPNEILRIITDYVNYREPITSTLALNGGLRIYGPYTPLSPMLHVNRHSRQVTLGAHPLSFSSGSLWRRSMVPFNCELDTLYIDSRAFGLVVDNENLDSDWLSLHVGRQQILYSTENQKCRKIKVLADRHGHMGPLF